MPLSTELRNVAATAMSGELSTLRLKTAAGATLANLTITFSAAASGGSRVGSLSGTASAGGDAEQWEAFNASSASRWTRTDALAVTPVGGGGSVELDQATTTIVQGQPITGTLTVSQGSLAAGET